MKTKDIRMTVAPRKIQPFCVNIGNEPFGNQAAQHAASECAGADFAEVLHGVSEFFGKYR